MASPPNAVAPASGDRATAWVPHGIFAGLAVAALVLIWLLIALLLSDGATWRLLLPWLLFLLPVLATGAALGWIAGLAVQASVRSRRHG